MTKINVTKEWCVAAAEREGNCEISAGVPEYVWAPMNELPPDGWRFADHVPDGCPDPREMRGFRLWMRETT